MAEQKSVLQEYDRYISGLFATEDDALRSARDEMSREGMPGISVSASEGKVLHILARIIGARRILEIGTLGGYSTIWLARALPPEGKLISLEIDTRYAEVARQNLKRAGVEEKVEIRVGPALKSLSRLTAEAEGPFDLVFIDADKDGYVNYLQKAMPLVREGGLVLGDNTLPDAVLDPAAESGTKRYNAEVSARPDLNSILIPVLRSRGIDGLLISIKQSQG
ncbi:MAG: O-methyltransferase [Verrucomicrobia bacterium]|nr:O-methyltransferase [Verrucomicrobiota bacterium]